MHPFNEGVKLDHEVVQKFFGRFRRHLAIITDQARGEMDVGFGGTHLRRIAEAQDAAKALPGETLRISRLNLPTR